MTRLQRGIGWALLVAGCASAPPHTPSTAQPGSAAALYARGQVAAARGDSTRAEQYFVLAVRAGYPDERAIGPLIEACVASSRLRSALAHAQAFLRRHPAAWRLRVLLASIRLALGDAEAAAKELERVLARHPEAADARYLLAVIARDAHHDEAATRAAFSAYLALDAGGSFAAEAEDWLADHPEQRSAAATNQAQP